MIKPNIFKRKLTPFFVRLGAFAFCLLFIYSYSYGQGKITGQVTDANTGSSLPGVTVGVKGSTEGTITGANGHFSIQAKANDSLVFSFVGYASKSIAVGDQSNIKIMLQSSNQQLNQLVVIGYGQKRKEDITTSVAEIKGGEVVKSSPVNISNALVGRLPGLTAVKGNGKPGASSSIAIRGSSTIGDNSVLVVIDGIVRSYSDFIQIDPNNIANISILKDAAATSVYGSRGANGVILVTTKRGQIGKPTFTYNGFVGIQQPTLYPKLMNGIEYAVTRNQARKNMGLSPYYTEEEINKFKKGEVPEVNWYDATLKKNALQTGHNMSVSGGSEAIKYFMSLGYRDQNGLYDKVNYKLYSLRSNVDAKINDNLTISVDIHASRADNNNSAYSPEAIFSDIMAAYPFDRIYNPDGTLFYTHEQHPVAEIGTGYNKQNTKIFDATLSFKQNIPFIEGLSISGKASFGKRNMTDKLYNVPIFMHREDSAGNLLEIYPFGGYQGKIAINKSFNEYNTITLNGRINYDHTFGDHNVSGLILFEQFDAKTSYLSAFRTNFPAQDLDELFFGGETEKDGNGGTYNDGRRSLVGRVNYKYKERYLFGFSFRRDASVAFPPENRYGFFPAFSAGWIISREPFFKNNEGLNFIDNLKLRGSYGIVGNDRNVYTNSGERPTFQYIQAYNLSLTPLISGGLPHVSITPGVLPNPDVTWETAHISDVGLDGSLWNNKLEFQIDAFYKRTTNILLPPNRSTPATLGADLPSVNYGIVNDKGIELSFTHRNNIGKFNYFVKLNGSFAENKVVQIGEPANIPDRIRQTGRPLGIIIGYKAIGFFQSDEEADKYYPQFGIKRQAGDVKYADINGDKKIDANDRIVISTNNSTPKIIGGLALGGSFENFDINVLFQGGAMMTQLLQGRSVTFFNGGSQNNFAYLSNYWTPDNPNAKFPRPTPGYNNNNSIASTLYLRNAGYIRLKSFNLGYTFSSNLLNNINIENLRVYLSGSNLFLFSKMKNWDPEIENTDGAYYPQQRILNIGVNLTF
jgi:TonB-linked SusC/RagA family outer membrane protein